jgi:hypothetical protein
LYFHYCYFQLGTRPGGAKRYHLLRISVGSNRS